MFSRIKNISTHSQEIFGFSFAVEVWINSENTVIALIINPGEVPNILIDSGIR